MKITDTKIQNLTLDSSGCTSRHEGSRSATQRMCAIAPYRTSAVNASAHLNAASAGVNFTTANAGVHANGTRGFWLAAPIFGTKRTTQWTRPD